MQGMPRVGKLAVATRKGLREHRLALVDGERLEVVQGSQGIESEDGGPGELVGKARSDTKPTESINFGGKRRKRQG